MHKHLVITLFLVIWLTLIQQTPFAVAGNVGSAPSQQGGQNALTSQEDTDKTSANKKIFPSPFAGTWYDADSAKLSAAIDGYMLNVPERVLPPVCALIMPHAGLQWSGQTAAYGIKQIEVAKIRRVIVLGPSHHVLLQNSASLPDATHYATPFAETPLDVDLIQELLQSRYFHVIPAANESEHSVQILLPALQRRLGEFLFVPIVLGRLDSASTQAVADILRRHLTPDTLVVASSDFTHYGSNFGYLPFTADIPENLKKLDMGAFKLIEEQNSRGFASYVQKTGATICGQTAIEVLLAMLPAKSRIQLLHYETSGAKTHDFSSSVSYLSAAVTGNWEAIVKEEKAPKSHGLSQDDKSRLMALAKGTLQQYLDKGVPPTPEKLGIEITPGMQQIMGAFVTLKKHENLRGCIGEITPVRPLYQAVMHRAIDAAVHDSRFSAVHKNEFSELSFEISALTPPTPVASYLDIVVGRDGVVLQKNGRSAVFLPQVAPEQGWGLEEMLSQLALKAGLPADAWMEGASFTVFQAIVFSESDL
ncbi:MAG: AmmeMemoRadiSam system protein B [Proteobacteria bacterium]|nr:AmmeMemoRadiSam system protein B [Pseudomonadota bacterium]